MLEEECDYVVKRLVCASNDTKYLIISLNFHYKRYKLSVFCWIMNNYLYLSPWTRENNHGKIKSDKNRSSRTRPEQQVVGR